MKDRRSGSERRGIRRLAVNIETVWENASGRKHGTINDLSLEGCFVLCSGEVEDGENVSVFLPLSDGMRVQFRGEVANHIYEIGFALRFTKLSDAQKDFLEKFIDKAVGK